MDDGDDVSPMFKTVEPQPDAQGPKVLNIHLPPPLKCDHVPLSLSTEYE